MRRYLKREEKKELKRLVARLGLVGVAIATGVPVLQIFAFVFGLFVFLPLVRNYLDGRHILSGVPCDMVYNVKHYEREII